MASLKKISLSPIGAAIRRSQKDLRRARQGASASTQRQLNAKIRKLDAHFDQIRKMCKYWDPVPRRGKY